MIWLWRLPVALVLLAIGCTVGLVGVPVRVLTGRGSVVGAGAAIVRSADRFLPFLGDTFVYFIQDEQTATKIGISGDPARRLATLQTGHPESLMLWCAIRCRSSAHARAVERDLHDHFAAHRMNGEWFDLDDRQLRTAVRLARRWR